MDKTTNHILERMVLNAFSITLSYMTTLLKIQLPGSCIEFQLQLNYY